MQAIIEQLQHAAAARSGVEAGEEPAGAPRAGRWFGFFVESTAPAGEGGPGPHGSNGARKRVWLQCPESGVSYLSLGSGGPPRLRRTPPGAASDAIALEPIHQHGRSWLLMRRPARRIRVNGLPAPRIAALRVGDQLQPDDEHLLLLSLLARPYVGPRLAEHADKTCPYCRTGFAADSIVQVCPRCATVLHCQGAEEPEGGRLECATLVSQCPTCGGPVVMKEEFAYVPD